MTKSGCWADWFNCVQLGQTDVSLQDSLHAGAHKVIGSKCVGCGKAGEDFLGDFGDVACSLNDQLFMFHHANIDRNRMRWMERHLDQESVHYGFDGDAGGWPLKKGVGINDVITSQFPFTSAQLGLAGLTSAGITHGDILCHVGPASAPYTYADPGMTDATCKTDHDCPAPGSYCMKDPTKTAPYVCHVPNPN